jgi:hypothetical protein
MLLAYAEAFVGCRSHALPKADAYASAIPMPMPLSYSTYV